MSGFFEFASDSELSRKISKLLEIGLGLKDGMNYFELANGYFGADQEFARAAITQIFKHPLFSGILHSFVHSDRSLCYLKPLENCSSLAMLVDSLLQSVYRSKVYHHLFLSRACS